MNRRVILLVGLAVATSAVVRSDGRKPVFKPSDGVLEQKDDLGKIAQMFGITPDALAHANRVQVADPFFIAS